MSKKISPLEALKEIKNHLSELHKEIDNDTFVHLYELLPFMVVEKSLKALEIIKRESEVVMSICWKSCKTQEEYDLLKEVLL